MYKTSQLHPTSLWSTLAFFGGPLLFGVFGLYWLLPTLDKLGIPLLLNYLFSVVSMFPLLLLLSLVAYRIETGSITWKGLNDRFRLKKLSRSDWKWTLVLLLIFVGGQLALMFTSTWLASSSILPLPEYLPHALDPRVPKTSLPTEFLGISLPGNLGIAVLYLGILFFNIIGEEFWWRGYILPRQELAHGKFAWLIHGTLWTLFHLPFWWNLIAILPSTLSLSYVAQRTQNSTPGIIVHSVMNGLGFVMILIGIVGGG